jgi:hypothetical protein
MEIPTITKLTFAESFIKPVLKLLASLIISFLSSTIAGIVLFFVTFLIFFSTGVAKGEFENPVGSIFMLPIASAFFTLIYGILVPIFSTLQIIIFGIPVAFIGWKFKFIRWWTSLIAGFLLSIFPWGLLYGIGTILQSSSVEFSNSSETIVTVVVFWLLGSCGAVGGYCFWLTLKLLRFPDIDGPLDIPQFLK